MTTNAVTGIYTAPAAATNAVAGKIIASADWNTIFADLAIGLNTKSQITSPPFIIAATTYTIQNVPGTAFDYSVIFNNSSTITVTLPAFASWGGRILIFRNINTGTVVSATSNVVPLVGGAGGTAILAGTAGKWAILQSDGATNWIIMAGN